VLQRVAMCCRSSYSRINPSKKERRLVNQSPIAYTAVCCRVLFFTATHCNTLQHTVDTVTHCNVLQHTASHCNTLQHTAIHCSTHLPNPERQKSYEPTPTCVYCNTLRHIATHRNTLQHAATHYDTLQHTTTHCSTL